MSDIFKNKISVQMVGDNSIGNGPYLEFHQETYTKHDLYTANGFLHYLKEQYETILMICPTANFEWNVCSLNFDGIVSQLNAMYKATGKDLIDKKANKITVPTAMGLMTINREHR